MPDQHPRSEAVAATWLEFEAKVLKTFGDMPKEAPNSSQGELLLWSHRHARRWHDSIVGQLLASSIRSAGTPSM
jgi:hypothetical protein